MARQKEIAQADSSEQQYSEKRQTRIDAVRRQGERELRKVKKKKTNFFDLILINKSLLEA
jgi:hypothetical protein